MDSGSLRDRVVIEAPQNARDSGGGAGVTYVAVATRSAEVKPLTARERLIAAQKQGRLGLRVRLRYFDGLTSRHRFRVGERILTIDAVLNPDGRKVEHVCDVTESV